MIYPQQELLSIEVLILDYDMQFTPDDTIIPLSPGKDLAEVVY